MKDKWDKQQALAGRDAVRLAKREDKMLQAAQGTKKCASADCQWAGQELPVTYFQKNVLRADGLDCWCKQCRNASTARYAEANPQRTERWAAVRNAHKRAKRAALKKRGDAGPQCCRKHPWMLLQDCDLDSCVPPKCDRRYGPKSAKVRQKISKSCRGYVRNKAGKNWGAKGNPLTQGPKHLRLTFQHKNAISAGVREKRTKKMGPKQ
jgi:hypothetical protein